MEEKFRFLFRLVWMDLKIMEINLAASYKTRVRLQCTNAEANTTSLANSFGFVVTVKFGFRIRSVWGSINGFMLGLIHTALKRKPRFSLRFDKCVIVPKHSMCRRRNLSRSEVVFASVVVQYERILVYRGRHVYRIDVRFIVLLFYHHHHYHVLLLHYHHHYLLSLFLDILVQWIS